MKLEDIVKKEFKKGKVVDYEVKNESCYFDVVLNRNTNINIKSYFDVVNIDFKNNSISIFVSAENVGKLIENSKA